jgi:hypothetical protein
MLKMICMHRFVTDHAGDRASAPREVPGIKFIIDDERLGSFA